MGLTAGRHPAKVDARRKGVVKYYPTLDVITLVR